MPALGGDSVMSHAAWMSPMARLKPGVTSVQAAKEIERLIPDPPPSGAAP